MNFDTKKELITLASNGDQRKLKWKTGVHEREYRWRPNEYSDVVLDGEDEFEKTENNISRQIYELQTKLEQVQLEKEQRMRVKPHQKEPIFTIEDETIKKIKEIVGKVERYKGVQQFVNESLENITTMWLEPRKMEEISAKMWKDITPEMLTVFREQVPDYVNMMDLKYGDHTKVATMKDEIEVVKDRLSKCKFTEPKNAVLGYSHPRSGYKAMYPIIPERFNRFFPLKILITSLASMIHDNLNNVGTRKDNESQWVDYEDFEKKAVELALEFSDKLKQIKSKDTPRNERVSTGLPVRHLDSGKKTEASKGRFLTHYVGPGVKSFFYINNSVLCATCKKILGKHDDSHDFSGDLTLNSALNEMGLVHIREKNGKLQITLSKDGFEFYNYKNPIIDEITVDKKTNEIDFGRNVNGLIENVFGKEENKFINEKIISKFELEKKVVKTILDFIKKEKSKVNTKQIDAKIKEVAGEWEKKHPELCIGPPDEMFSGNPESQIIKEKTALWRMATMGRLAEIGEVEWDIIDRQSYYSINK